MSVCAAQILDFRLKSEKQNKFWHDIPFLQLLKSKSIPWLKVSHLHVSTNFYLVSEITFNNYCNAEIERKINLDKTALGTLKVIRIGTFK